MNADGPFSKSQHNSGEAGQYFAALHNPMEFVASHQVHRGLHLSPAEFSRCLGIHVLQHNGKPSRQRYPGLRYCNQIQEKAELDLHNKRPFFSSIVNLLNA